MFLTCCKNLSEHLGRNNFGKPSVVFISTVLSGVKKCLRDWHVLVPIVLISRFSCLHGTEACNVCMKDLPVFPPCLCLTINVIYCTICWALVFASGEGIRTNLSLLATFQGIWSHQGATIAQLARQIVILCVVFAAVCAIICSKRKVSWALHWLYNLNEKYETKASSCSKIWI